MIYIGLRRLWHFCMVILLYVVNDTMLKFYNIDVYVNSVMSKTFIKC